MWKKIVVAGAVGGVVLGSGAAALAATSSTAPSSSTAASPNSAGSSRTATKDKHSRRDKFELRLSKLEHGEWVTHDKTGDVTHDAVGGLVTALSPTTISVRAADGFSATYTVSSTTKVHLKGTKGATITSVKVNDQVLLSGIKSGSTTTANHIIDLGVKK